MLRRVSLLPKDAFRRSRPSHINQRWFSQANDDHRLRILFCGSDDFSITSLRALHSYSQEAESSVASIDVAAKTDKRVGRGLKIIRPPPIKPVAQELGLPIHQFDTFRGWSLPIDNDGRSHINMVIAVSFGLLVPPRILGACQYGGLNVHPSMLPDLKGSAPIEHSIILGYRQTGVTVQTLHPSKFDEGNIVMQTSAPGLDIPRPEHITSLELREYLAPIGAEMLVESLRSRAYLHPKARANPDGLQSENHAPKLSPESRHVVFQEMSSTHILRLNRALGRLWVNAPAGEDKGQSRIILGQNIGHVAKEGLAAIPPEFLSQVSVGVAFNVTADNVKLEESKSPLIIKTNDSKFVAIHEMTVSGTKPGYALASAARAGLMERVNGAHGREIYAMKGPLV